MKRGSLTLVWLFLQTSLSACGTPQPTTAPTPALTEFPTFPAAFASSTPVMIPPPVFTPPPRPLTPTLSPFAAALAKTQAASQYRVALTLNVKQGSALPFALDLKGQVNGGDAHCAYQLGSDKIEFRAVRGQSFVKGAHSLGLPTTTK